MIYSKTCEYALRGLSHLTSKERGVFAMASEVCRKTGVPASYIAKIFQGLVRNGVLESRRGPNGGFAFKRPPGSLSLFEIIKMVDDVSPLLNDCVMGLDHCSSSNACPLHALWVRTKESIQKTLKRTTLIQMKKRTGKLRFRQFFRPRLQPKLGLVGRCA